MRQRIRQREQETKKGSTGGGRQPGPLTVQKWLIPLSGQCSPNSGDSLPKIHGASVQFLRMWEMNEKAERRDAPRSNGSKSNC